MVQPGAATGSSLSRAVLRRWESPFELELFTTTKYFVFASRAIPDPEAVNVLTESELNESGFMNVPIEPSGLPCESLLRMPTDRFNDGMATPANFTSTLVTA